MAMKVPISPKPAGPSIIAIALVRSMPMKSVSTDAPPTRAEDLRDLPVARLRRCASTSRSGLLGPRWMRSRSA